MIRLEVTKIVPDVILEQAALEPAHMLAGFASLRIGRTYPNPPPAVEDLVVSKI